MIEAADAVERLKQRGRLSYKELNSIKKQLSSGAPTDLSNLVRALALAAPPSPENVALVAKVLEESQDDWDLADKRWQHSSRGEAMIYENVTPISRGEAEALLRGASATESATTLIRVALHEPDRAWAERLFLKALDDGRSEVRAAAVTGLGHLARIHCEIDSAALDALRALRDDPLLGGLAEDALDDVSTFVAAPRQE
ncbi:MAG TPA: hypothetical protein DEH78_30625 [Solibacterales bacterium]|nr:hypothetical protein [Bryobacterales bacterium]